MPEIVTPNIVTPADTATTTTPQAVSSLSATVQPTVQNVYSPTNVSQAMTQPTTTLDLNDPLGMKTSIESGLGLPGLRTAEQAAQAELTAAKQAGRAQQTALGNLPQALGVIRGEQAQAQTLQSQREQSLAENLGVAQTARLAAEQQAAEKFNILQSERQYKINLAMENPGAGISMTDNYETIAKKVTQFKQDQIDKEYKNKLKASLMELGLKSSGSTKDLEKRLRKYNKGLADQAKQEADIKLQSALADLNKKLSGGAGGAQNMDIASYYNDTPTTQGSQQYQTSNIPQQDVYGNVLLPSQQSSNYFDYLNQ